MKKFIFTLIILLSTITLFAHPIKMTTGRMAINTEKDSLSVSIKFFIDDFEAAIVAFYPQPPFDFKNPSEEMTFAIDDYVQHNFVIKANKTKVPLKMTTVKSEEENVCEAIFYGKSDQFKTLEFLMIQNTLLFDTYEMQSNILELKIDKEKPQTIEFYPQTGVKIINR